MHWMSDLQFWIKGCGLKIYEALSSKPILNQIGWFCIACVYIAFLLFFTHIDLIISAINEIPEADIKNLMIRKHAHFASLFTNVSLLLFLVIDIMFIKEKKVSTIKIIASFIVGVLACIALTMFAIGCVNVQMKEFGGIKCEPGIWLCLALFGIMLVYIKKRSLTYNFS